MLAAPSRSLHHGDFERLSVWTILTELGRGVSRDRERGWGVQKCRECVEFFFFFFVCTVVLDYLGDFTS